MTTVARSTPAGGARAVGSSQRRARAIKLSMRGLALL
jgi:hypothetical protein